MTILKHRKIKLQELDKDKCFCCNKIYSNLIIHHIDGNHKNNRQSNLIVLCSHCHLKTHFGLNKKDKNMSSEIKENICVLRRKLLKAKKWNNKDIEDRIQYELFKTSYKKIGIGITKKTCRICNSKKDLIKINILPKSIRKFEREQSKYIIVLCKKCKKELYHQ